MPRVSLLALLLVARLAAQTSGGKPASVEGVVTDSATGAPVLRAHVTLTGSASDQVARRYGATSGADGRFTFPEVVPGSYSLNAQRAGYVHLGKFPTLGLKTGDAPAAIEMRLTPLGAIAGRVIGPDGEPVEGASVEARDTRDVLSSRITDERGQFRLGGLAPGRYFVRVVSGDSHQDGGRPEIRTDGTAEVHTADTWYPGVLTRAGAARIEVKPGADSAGLEIKLLQTPFVRVSGKVIGMPRSIERQSAVLTAWHEDEASGIPLKPDGSFEVWRLSPGFYRLQAEWTTPTGQRIRTTSAEVQVGATAIDNVELRVVPDSNLTGRLEFDDEQAKQFSRKEGNGNFGRRIRLVDMANDQVVAQAPVQDDDNTFHLEKIPAGRYRLTIDWDDAYVRSMSVGSNAIDGAVLDLRSGSIGTGVVVRLSAATGSITGKVEVGDADKDDCLVVLTSPDDSFQMRTTIINDDGTYSFPHLPPGTFQLVAVGDNDYGIENNTVPGFEKQMETVTVAPGSRVTQDLRLRTAE